MVDPGAKTKTIMPTAETMVVEMNTVPVLVSPAISEMLSPIILLKIQTVMIQPIPITVEVALMVNCVAKINKVRI